MLKTDVHTSILFRIVACKKQSEVFRERRNSSGLKTGFIHTEIF